MLTPSFKQYLCQCLRLQALQKTKPHSLLHEPLSKWGNAHLKELEAVLEANFSHAFLRRLLGLDSRSVETISKTNKALITKVLGYSDWESLVDQFVKEQQNFDELYELFRQQQERLAKIENLLERVLERLK